jgi:hypothetical protein
MALQAAGGFATFGITDGAQIRDISPVLADAIYYDLHLLGNLNVDFGDPATDIQHWWNEDLLNADTVTGTSVYNSATTTVNVTSGQGTRVHVGDLLVARNNADNTGTAGLTLQVTAIATDALTTAWLASGATSSSASFTPSFAIIPGEQEGSDIGSDKSNSPTVRSNYTQIFAGRYDVKVTGSQLARQMATQQMQDFVARQLSNRAIELKIGMSRAALYSVRSGPGTASAYRYMGGLRDWINNNSGVTDTASGSLSYTYLNTQNKTIVDKGVFPDTLIIGTDLVGSVTGIDATNRRLLESDRVAGYTIQQVQLQQGNTVNVVVDSRVNTGDAFLVSSERIRMVPLQGRGMFVIAAVDFADAKKRRVLGEWTMEVRNPEAQGYFANKIRAGIR